MKRYGNAPGEREKPTPLSLGYESVGVGRDVPRRVRAESGFMLACYVVYMIIVFGRPQASIPAIGLIRPGMILGVTLFLFSIANFDHTVYKETIVRAMIGFVALGACSVLYATNTYWAFNYTQTVFTYCFALVIPTVLLINSIDRLQRLLYVFISVHVYLAGYALLNGGRGPGGFIADENDVALALNVALPFIYFALVRHSQRRTLKLLLGACGFVVVAAIITTMSRGGFIGLAITSLAIVWYSRNRLRNALLVGLTVVIAALLVPTEYVKEIQSISDTEDGTRAERLHSWGYGWDMFLDNPIVGVGFGNYPWRVNEYQSVESEGPARMLGGRVAHSLYFTLIPETGAVGVFLFVLIALRIRRYIRGALRASAEPTVGPDAEVLEAFARGALVGTVAYLATGVFISVLYYPWFWYLAAFACVSNRLSQEIHRSPGSGMGEEQYKRRRGSFKQARRWQR